MIQESSQKENDIFFLKKAFFISANSVANKRKVGAIIVANNTNDILATGFNKMFNNLKTDICENSEGKSYECVIHAEEDAIISFLNKKVYDDILESTKTIYITYTPCIVCCKLIAHAGITRVVYCNEHPVNFTKTQIADGYSPKAFLETMGIKVIRIPYEEIYHETPEEVKPNIALIHHIDNDGLTCAWLLSKIYHKELSENKAELIAYNYGTDISCFNKDQYDIFIFADVTPPIEWLLKNRTNIELGKISIEIFDHHKDKCDQIKEQKISRLKVHFANNISGSKILFNFLIRDKPELCKRIIKNQKNYFYDNDNSSNLKILIDFISLYDTWKFANINFNKQGEDGIKDYYFHFTKENVLAFNIYMQMYHTAIDFIKEMDYIYYNTFDTQLRQIFSNGELLIGKIKSENDSIIYRGKYYENNKFFFYSGYPNYFIREQIKEKYPESEYWIGYQINNEKQEIAFSLRSEIKEDCNLIAKRWPNGGGHSKAAGIKLSFEQGMDLIINPEKIFTHTNKFQ